MPAEHDLLDIAPYTEEVRRASRHLDPDLRNAWALVLFATTRPSGREIVVPVRCRRRPDNRPCGTWLHAHRSDAPPAVDWHCPGCDSGGRIVGWYETWMDLIHWDANEEHTVAPARLSYAAFEMLLEVAPLWADLTLVAADAQPRDDGDVDLYLDEPIGATSEAVLALRFDAEPKSARGRRQKEVLGALLPADRPDWVSDPPEVQAEIEAFASGRGPVAWRR